MLWTKAQRLAPDSPDTLLALGYYQYRVLRDFGAAKTTVGASANCYPAAARPVRSRQSCPIAGHWDQSIAYFEQALALDPGNVELLLPRHCLRVSSTISGRAKAL